MATCRANRCCWMIPLLTILLWTLAVSAKRHKKPWFCENRTQQSQEQESSQDSRGGSDGDSLSFLWSVRREPAAYFFGTIHVPYTRVWDYIPDNAKQAFEAADNVFFELDLMDPGTISALANCQLLPKGQSLVDLLPRDIYSRLKRHLDYVKTVMPTWMTADQRGRGLYADYLFNAITGNWERKRPVWVMLMVNSLTESDIKSRGIPVLDLFLAQEAERANKRAGAVERVEEQCLPLNGLNFSQVVFALNLTLAQHEGLRSGDSKMSSYTTDDLIKHYNCGDLDSVIFNRDTTQVPTLGISNGGGGTESISSRLSTLWTTKSVNQPYQDQEEARFIDDYFRDELIYKRNKRMAQRVAQLLRTYPDQTFFFAFGAGHYLGNNTVLDFVQDEGYEVEQIPPNRRLRSKKSKDNRKDSFFDGGGSPSSRSGGQFSDDVGGGLRARNGNHTRPSLLHLPALLNQAGRSYERLLEESAFKKPALIVPLNRRFGIWKRRPSGHPFSYHSTVHLVRTTSAPSRPAPRKFNDLWVRLESYSTREPFTSPHEGYLQDEVEDSELVKKSIRIWYGIASGDRSPVNEVQRLTTLTIILCVYVTIHTMKSRFL